MRFNQRLVIRTTIKFFFVISFLTVAISSCSLRTIKAGHNVCVCNATYCDTVPPINTQLPSDKYQLYSTTQNRLGFIESYESFGRFVSKPVEGVIQVDSKLKHQTIIGFGGAFTDSTGINVASLPKTAQDFLLKSYFSEQGIEYSLCRVPIGGTDFSTRGYSYVDAKDANDLFTFQLQIEDFQYKIPLIHKAKQMRNNRSFKLVASSWSAPLWMKTSHEWSGGELKEEHYQKWADYYVKFLDAYGANGINFWGVTTQNEPTYPVLQGPINSMYWSASNLNKWIVNNFGPTLRASVYHDIKIILHDDNRLALPFMYSVIDNNDTLEYADGVGVHWYVDFAVPNFFLDFAKTPKKDLFIIYTESCNGFLYVLNVEPAVDLGSWQRGQNYLQSIIKLLKEGVSGWIDWNMVLDLNGGPTYVRNFVDSPILVNKTVGEFYKQPMYYVLGHFAKFVAADSVRIEAGIINEKRDGVDVVAFERPDNLTAVILTNSLDEDLIVEVRIDESRIAFVTLQANSLNTLLCTTI